jgi:hypothetical protein
MISSNNQLLDKERSEQMPQKKHFSEETDQTGDTTQRSTATIATNKGAARKITKLNNDSDIIHVRRVVAGNPNTPLTVLSRLAEDECESIRRSVAENPKTPVEMLQMLSFDPSPEVRLGVAENPHTPSSTLTMLANDEAIDVRYGVAENPHMPEDILVKLARDENPYVRCRALKTLQMLAPDVQSRLIFVMQQPFDD